MDAELNPFPNDFPDGVPPDTATDANGEAFRLVVSNPPTTNDFIASHLEPHNKGKKRNLAPSDYGTSMFRDKNELKKMQLLCKPQRGKLVAKGILEKKHGLMSKENHKSHFELWIRQNSAIEQDFNILDE